MALKVTNKQEIQTVENTPSDIVDFMGQATLEVYGINHPLYQKALDRIEDRKLKESIFSLNEQSYNFETQIEVVGNYLVKDWTGFVDDNDKPLELTPENFKKACLDYPDLLPLVITEAVKIQTSHYEKASEVKKK